MIKLLVTYLFLGFALLLFYSCSEKASDSFYSNSCGYDCKKIPLIKPFYLGSTTGIDGEWNLSGLNNKDGAISVISIDVKDSIIVSYYFDKHIVVPEKRDTTWYIHVPAQMLEYKFSSEQEFYEQMNKLTNKRVAFIDVPILYKNFIKRGYLDWFPEEYKSK